MLSITLIALLLAIPLSSSTISATLLTRITAVALLFAAALSYNGLSSDVGLDAGLGLYSGLIHATTITQYMEVFLLVSGALILLPWSVASSHISAASIMQETTDKSVSYSSTVNNAAPTIPEYPMIVLFTTLGGTFLLASADLVSMYLAIELQSFGVYILSALYRDSESATSAGLKYFLLGALSSALILLGSALVYGYTGLTNLDSIYELLSVPSSDSDTGVASPYISLGNTVTLGFIIISIGLLFKVASAPFHYWAPDVYDGTPTIVTTWLTVMPKISIFVFLLELYRGVGTNNLFGDSSYGFVLATSPTLAPAEVWGGASVNLLLICAFLSLVIGTVVGLGQYRFKRLMAYSTISHVGFLLLALAIASSSANSNGTTISRSPVTGGAGGLGEDSVEAFLFYIVQYSLTNINAFFVLLAFGYMMSSTVSDRTNPDVQFISELQGQFRFNPVLGFSLAICLFSMAGVPPLVGFFAKYTVLYSAIHGGYTFLAIVAILASVVSAAYYLRVIRVVHFDAPYAQASVLSNSLALAGEGGVGVENTITSTPTPLGQVQGVVQSEWTVSSVHSYIISTLTLFIMLFAVNPSLLLNSTSIMALSLYTT